MASPEDIIKLTKVINRELEHFIPCVHSEIEAKTMISNNLVKIRSIALEILRSSVDPRGNNMGGHL